MARFNLVCVVGTRPEGIKMAPVVKELREYPEAVEVVLVSSGQHREMLAQALKPFGLVPDIDLDLMQHGQSLSQLTTRILDGLEKVVSDQKPDYVLGQGDTTTCFVASLVSFYHGIPFAHVEAGLRTASILSPFPEEFNRRAVSLTAALNFAPTIWAKENLEKEGIDSKSIFVTGNTGIDAVLFSSRMAHRDSCPADGHRILLLTTHRRENWGKSQEQIARAVHRLVQKHEDIEVIVPMHRNPQVREVLYAGLGNLDRVKLIEPPDYEDFVQLLKNSYLVLTDSGGVQEEAPAFGVPVLVLRDQTERPEGVTSGVAKLVGTDEDTVFNAADELLSSAEQRSKMARASSPYGDGRASKRIRQILLRSLGIESPEV